LAQDMREKVSLVKMDELSASFHKFQTIHHSSEESLTQKFNMLKEDYESKIKELNDSIEDLKNEVA